MPMSSDENRPHRASHHHGGSASIRFDRSPDGQSYVSSQRVAYPFHVTRPFYLQGDPEGTASLYLQSLSGGVFAGDTLSLALEVGSGAMAHVTTGGSTLVHRMDGGGAVQLVDLSAEDGSLLEYLPDSLVLFPGSDLDTRVRIRCGPRATVLVSDIYFCHDPLERGRGIGRLRSELRVERPDGSLVCLDRFEIGADQLAAAPRRRAHGTFMCISSHLPDGLIERIREALETFREAYCGVSELPDGAGIWMRVLADDSRAPRAAVAAAWREVRTDLFGIAPRARPK